MATKRGSTPAVAARTAAMPSSLGGRQRLGVEVVDDLHVVGDEADRHEHHRRSRPSVASSSRWSLTSGSSHGVDGAPEREQ